MLSRNAPTYIPPLSKGGPGGVAWEVAPAASGKVVAQQFNRAGKFSASVKVALGRLCGSASRPIAPTCRALEAPLQGLAIVSEEIKETHSLLRPLTEN